MIELEQVNYPVEEDMEEVEVCAVLVSSELNRMAVVTMSTIPLDAVEAGSGADAIAFRSKNEWPC